MPFDVIPNLFELDNNLNFELSYEDSKLAGHKFGFNVNTGEAISHTKNTFNCVSHPTFFNSVKEVILDNREPHELIDARVKQRSCRNNAWAMVDITLPKVVYRIYTDKHQTDISERIILLHGIDGSCSNVALFGGIDWYCTNGQIRGKYDLVKKKNTSGFSIETFVSELQTAKADFDVHCRMLQVWAETPIKANVRLLLDKIVKSERLSKKMYSLAQQEISKRGKNMYALYSAFTNYSSYADDRNGFSLRNTGNDTKGESMWKREQQVSQWIDSKPFQDLLVA